MAERTREVGIKVAHYKAFGEEPQGFDKLPPVNVIIGRNNSGKSSLVDLIEWAVESPNVGSDVKMEGRTVGRHPTVIHTMPYPVLLPNFRPGTPADQVIGRGGNWKKQLSPSEWHIVSEFWDEVRVEWVVGSQDVPRIVSQHSPQVSVKANLSETVRQFLQQAARSQKSLSVAHPLRANHFFRLAAERSVGPERLNVENLGIKPNGSGITNILNRFITDATLSTSVVEDRLLASLNAVFEPDASFSRIQTQRTGEFYEIFLQEEQKGAVPLSKSGSGLQTVLLVLAALDVLPQIPDNSADIGDWVFAFEELENNLHPALQRRLFWLIRERAVEHNATVFLTTHSPIVVDLFAEDDQAQIIHVTHDGQCATATPVLTYASRRGIFDDLDVRASDLLQANGIVWVEGPTDRMYFNRWIQLWTDGKLREGKDYQCVFYGGRLLNHLSAEEPGDHQREAIEILRVNRNAIVLIDSDKRRLRDSVNNTKKRLAKEVSDGGGLAWITKGREVEQYVPHAAFTAHFDHDVPVLDQFGDVLEYLNQILSKPDRKRYDKIQLAESLLPFLTRDDLADHLDLSDRLNAVCAAIRSWSKKPTPPPRDEPA